MISRERIEQLRSARIRWQDVDDLIAALDEREELLAIAATWMKGILDCTPVIGDSALLLVEDYEKIQERLRGGRFEVK